MTAKSKAHLNIITIILRLILQIMGWILLCWLVAELILLITSVSCGYQLSARVVDSLLNYEKKIFLLKIMPFSALHTIVQFDSNIMQSLQQLAQSIPSPDNWDARTHNKTLLTIFHGYYPSLASYAFSTLAITQIVLLRITEVILFIPLTVLLGLVGFFHGLVQRYLRCLNGGRESSLLYHYAKAAIKPCLFWGGLLYVILPFPLDSTTFLVPCVVTTSLAIFLTTKTFKKYI